jgi:hypothetical protein
MFMRLELVFPARSDIRSTEEHEVARLENFALFLRIHS